MERNQQLYKQFSQNNIFCCHVIVKINSVYIFTVQLYMRQCTCLIINDVNAILHRISDI